jgi:hypothetical protein
MQQHSQRISVRSSGGRQQCRKPRHRPVPQRTSSSEWGAGVFQISGRFVAGPIERLGRVGVKASMDLVRTVICSLLPALWVLAAGNCLADSVCRCADGCGQTSISAREHSSHPPPKDALVFEQLARLLNGRTGTQPGWGSLLIPTAVSASGPGELEFPCAPLTISAEAFGLAKRWQFHWRTALEPRAPSSVS